MAAEIVYGFSYMSFDDNYVKTYSFISGNIYTDNTFEAVIKVNNKYMKLNGIYFKNTSALLGHWTLENNNGNFICY